METLIGRAEIAFPLGQNPYQARLAAAIESGPCSLTCRPSQTPIP
jgi:hypothetical protein